MIAELQTGYAGAQAALKLLKGMLALKTEAERNQAVIDIQRHVLDAQSALADAQQEYTTSLKTIDDLKQEIVRLKDWSAEKERYELADAGQGAFAYRLKDSMQGGEPPHWLCPHCYQHGEKSLLKREVIPQGRAETLVCHPCGYDIVTRGVRHTPAPTAAVSRRGR